MLRRDPAGVMSAIAALFFAVIALGSLVFDGPTSAVYAAVIAGVFVASRFTQRFPPIPRVWTRRRVIVCAVLAALATGALLWVAIASVDMPIRATAVTALVILLIGMVRVVRLSRADRGPPVRS